MESLGALSLFVIWSKDIPNPTERLWWSVFHSISAFCNAGFCLAVNSFEDYVNNPFICFVIITLITVGGLGFFVISDLSDPEVWKVKRLKAIWNRLEIQTRVVLLVSIFLNISGMLLFLFFEYDGALHGLSTQSKLLASLFQSVVLRTAGFFTVPMGYLSAPTVMFCVVWMFIGASPQSTGGGIKTTTAAVSLMTIKAMLRGREHVEMMGRTIPSVIVHRSLSILLIASFIVVFFLMLMLATQELPFTNLLFETVSAFGTAGLSMDTSPLLNDVGKILIICVMYIGRIGPLTLALAIGEKKSSQGYLFPQGRLVVG
jgi:trk system potassium uptake protein TrkH